MLGKLMLDKWQALRVLVTIALVAEGANLIPVIANDGKMPATIRSWEYPLEDYQDYQKYTVATSKTPFVWLGDWVRIEPNMPFPPKMAPRPVLWFGENFLFGKKISLSDGMTLISPGDCFLVVARVLALFIFLDLLLIFTFRGVAKLSRKFTARITQRPSRTVL